MTGRVSSDADHGAKDEPARRAADEHAVGFRSYVLDLQQSVGNARVAALVRSGRLGAPTLARQPRTRERTPEQVFDAELAASHWEAAAVALDRMPAGDVTGKVATLTTGQCRRLLGALRISRRVAAANQIERPLKDRSSIADGEIFGTVTTERDPHSAPSAADLASYDMWIQFSPDASVVDCREIAVVQAVRLTTTASGANAEILQHLINRQTPDAWAIDRIEDRRFGFYGYGNRGTASGDPGTRSAPVGGGNIRPGSSNPRQDMHYFDGPQTRLRGVTFEFETAIVARTGPQAGLVYSVVTWGFQVAADGTVTHRPVATTDRISATFTASREAWNAQARGPRASRNDPRQVALPSLR
jgi:hypothetical protein